ncbi:Transcription antitermination factor NusG [Desulfacinum hydrothermale DSM 13146]|uniref:Transcription antitermination factor NusG n=1 Tax=Desulfacinum hydrothermale DSM 13146 TaxID=1121390 RepID=A0A1W1XVU0_9BACT|nr:UpxY family transcription antiterminator [Desulfacinum hydrothermale]SMC27648.1 Transcription antitermination factor NusG [Desulfacinum hydrothermale DSM 13146]
MPATDMKGTNRREGKLVQIPEGPEPFREDIAAWYALYVQVNHEKKVAEMLVKKRIDCFLPLVEKWSKRRDRRLRIQVPIFPGYLFVHATLDNPTHVEILKIPGSVYILKNQHGPMPIPTYQVESLRTMLTGAQDLTVHPYLKEGDWVQVVRGPLVGCVGLLVRLNPKRGKLVINVDVIQKAASVELDMEDVIRIDPPQSGRKP